MRTACTLLFTLLVLPLSVPAQDTAEAILARAYDLQQRGLHAQAIALVRPLIDSNSLDREDLGRAWETLGLAYLDAGDNPAAKHAFTESVSILKPLPNPLEYAVALNNFSDFYFLTGDPATATRIRQQALAIFQQLGDHGNIARTCNRLAGADLQFGNKKRGRTYLECALHESQLTTAFTSDDRASLYMMQAGYASADHHWNVAIDHMNHAIDIWYSSLGEVEPNVGWARVYLGQIYEYAGRLSDAVREMQQGISDIEQSIGSATPSSFKANLVYADLLDRRGDHAAASRLRATAEAGLSPDNRTPCNGCTISVNALR